jgi:general secretion pathway protein G
MTTGAILAVIAVLALLIASSVTVIRPADLTRTTMTVLESRIGQYVERNGRLPGSLSELPEDTKRISAITDGWGRPIYYSTNNGKVTLMSYGKDGRLGGTGEDADIIHDFPETVAVEPGQTGPVTNQ